MERETAIPFRRAKMQGLTCALTRTEREEISDGVNKMSGVRADDLR